MLVLPRPTLGMERETSYVLRYEERGHQDRIETIVSQGLDIVCHAPEYCLEISSSLALIPMSEPLVPRLGYRAPF